MGVTKDFQIEGKNVKTTARIKDTKNMPEQKDALARCGPLCLSGLVAAKKRLAAAARNSLKVSRKRNEIPQGRRPGGAQTTSLWPCYTKLSCDKEK